MRKIERQMQAAIATRTDWKKSNTSVDVDSEGYTTVRLHGNRIAEIEPNGDIIQVHAVGQHPPPNQD